MKTCMLRRVARMLCESIVNCVVRLRVSVRVKAKGEGEYGW